MISSGFIEDIFIEFSKLVDHRAIAVQRQDISIIQSFTINILSDNQLTENQGRFILKLLHKYRNLCQIAGFDYLDSLDSPVWKNNFRTIDYTKKIFVELDETGKIFICAKFPYQLKKQVDEEICGEKISSYQTWDPERKIRKFQAEDFNVIQIYEFVKNNNFEIDESFLDLVAQVEEIWADQEKISPYSTIQDGQVVLHNTTADAADFWNTNKNNNLINDLLLAKDMGFLLAKNPENPIEKIASSDTNSFWLNSNREFLEICKQVDGKICIVLDRVGRTLEWLDAFTKELDLVGIPRREIKVCFRADKTENPELNEWIRSNGFGGKVNEGKILIFNHKPAKWLFKESTSVKILASNNLYPSTNQISRDWFSSHPCVIYLGDIKPSQNKEQKIVNL
jgi:hypothetical protein